MRFEPYQSNVFALIFLFVCSLLSAQVVPVAQVNGTVKDQSDALLPGVGVRVTQTETGYTHTCQQWYGNLHVTQPPRGTVPAGGFLVSRITCKRELCCR